MMMEMAMGMATARARFGAPMEWMAAGWSGYFEVLVVEEESQEQPSRWQVWRGQSSKRLPNPWTQSSGGIPTRLCSMLWTSAGQRKGRIQKAKLAWWVLLQGFKVLGFRVCRVLRASWMSIVSYQSIWGRSGGGMGWCIKFHEIVPPFVDWNRGSQWFMIEFTTLYSSNEMPQTCI
jgi:hypothetical protein